MSSEPGPHPPVGDDEPYSLEDVAQRVLASSSLSPEDLELRLAAAERRSDRLYARLTDAEGALAGAHADAELARKALRDETNRRNGLEENLRQRAVAAQRRGDEALERLATEQAARVELEAMVRDLRDRLETAEQRAAELDRTLHSSAGFRAEAELAQVRATVEALESARRSAEGRAQEALAAREQIAARVGELEIAQEATARRLRDATAEREALEEKILELSRANADAASRATEAARAWALAEAMRQAEPPPPHTAHAHR